MATPTHVRVVYGRIAPGKLPELVAAIEQNVIPALRDVGGFEHAEVLVDDDGIRVEFRSYFSDCPMGSREAIMELYEALSAKTLAGDIGAEVEDFRRLKLEYPRPLTSA